MAQLNQAPRQIKTHEGAPAKHIGAKAELERAVMACMLWESQFYESGVDIADRIGSLVEQIQDVAWLSDLTLKARTDMKLRHAPLLICAHMARTGKLKASVLAQVIQRADELSEFVALFWSVATFPKSRATLTRQVKRGLATAFRKFDEYQLAKYDRAKNVRLRDVLFLCHPKPKDLEQERLWKRLVDGTLEPPDTWEVALSGGEDKKAAWERLLQDHKLGALALLRNLRNIDQAGVDRGLVRQSIHEINTKRILPFRFVAAARHAPWAEPELESALFRSLEGERAGKTVIVVDHSGSMSWSLSARSDMTRWDAGAALAMIARELYEDVVILVFSNDVREVAPRRGFGLRDHMTNAISWGGTFLGAAVRRAATYSYDRIVVLTDEQSHDRVPDPIPGSQAYMINVASYRNGVGYGAWTHIDGFSEAVFNYIDATENQ